MVYPLWYYAKIHFNSFFFLGLCYQFFNSGIWVILSLQENLYGKPLTLADRETVEEKADDILAEAQGSNVAFLVVGDPFGYSQFSFPFFFPD